MDVICRLIRWSKADKQGMFDKVFFFFFWRLILRAIAGFHVPLSHSKMKKNCLSFWGFSFVRYKTLRWIILTFCKAITRQCSSFCNPCMTALLRCVILKLTKLAAREGVTWPRVSELSFKFLLTEQSLHWTGPWFQMAIRFSLWIYKTFFLVVPETRFIVFIRTSVNHMDILTH